MFNSAKGTDNIPNLLYPGMVWYGRIEKYHVFILEAQVYLAALDLTGPGQVHGCCLQNRTGGDPWMNRGQRCRGESAPPTPNSTQCRYRLPDYLSLRPGQPVPAFQVHQRQPEIKSHHIVIKHVHRSPRVPPLRSTHGVSSYTTGLIRA